jgi:NADPH2:quinone reductase
MKPGGPETLVWTKTDMPEPKEGEVLIRQKAVGLNFIDVYHRSGLYPLASYPAILGMEASGVVEKVGKNCKLFKVGDRVMYGTGTPGAYTEYRTIMERHLMKIPDFLSFEIAAGLMLKGLTAQYLLRRTFQVRIGQTMLVYAASGGVGQLLCQWGNFLGATVIGVVGNASKVKQAMENGCKHVIDSSKEDIAARVMEITKGDKVNVVYDSVGKDTFMTSLDCLMPLGFLVSYGQSSGKIPPFDIGVLAQKGSLFVTRPTLHTYTHNYSDFLMMCGEMLDMVYQGVLKVKVGQSYYLKDAAHAHEELEARKTTGASILVV